MAGDRSFRGKLDITVRTLVDSSVVSLYVLLQVALLDESPATNVTLPRLFS